MDKNKSIEKLERQRKLLTDLQASGVDSASFKKWERDTELAIEYVFGKDTRHLPDFRSVSFTPGSYDLFDPDPEWNAAFINGRQAADALLRSMIEEIEEYWTEDVQPQDQLEKQIAQKKNSRDLFVVHGRNEACRETVARFLEKLNLKPIILHEQPNKGRTIIEKFVDYSDVSFAVILLTADDRGGLASDSFDAQRP